MKMNKKGFTLVELMVVLAILGLLAGIGIPQYTNVLNRAKIGADIARVAGIQSAVDAFISECGGVKNVSSLATPFTALADNTALTDLWGKSIITGQPIQLTVSTLDSATALTTTLAAMESKEAKASGVGWYINANGKVYIGTGSGSVLK